MIFRYDFGDKLNLNRFSKQLKHYISNLTNLSKLEYDLYLKSFLIVIKITKTDEVTHLIEIDINYLEKDKDNNIINEKLVFPKSDDRFLSFPEISNLFSDFSNTTVLAINDTENDINDLIKSLCNIITVIHKINYLKIFL